MEACLRGWRGHKARVVGGVCGGKGTGQGWLVPEHIGSYRLLEKLGLLLRVRLEDVVGFPRKRVSSY